MLLSNNAVLHWDPAQFVSLHTQLFECHFIAEPKGETTNCDALSLSVCMYVYRYICICQTSR